MDQLSIVCIASTMESTFQAKWLSRAVLFPICYMNFIITLHIWSWKLHSFFFFFFLHALLFWHFIFKSSQRTSWQKNLGGSLLISLWGQSLEKHDILPSTGSRAPLLQQGAWISRQQHRIVLCLYFGTNIMWLIRTWDIQQTSHKSVPALSQLPLQAEMLQMTRAMCQCYGWLLPKFWLSVAWSTAMDWARPVNSGIT